jgi:hypothetical protein
VTLSSAAFEQHAELHSEFVNESMFARTAAAPLKLRFLCRPQTKLLFCVPAGDRAPGRSTRLTEAAFGDSVKCCRLVTRLRLSRWLKAIRPSMTLRDALNILVCMLFV